MENMFALVEFDGRNPSRVHAVIFAKDRYDAMNKAEDMFDRLGNPEALDDLDLQPMYPEDNDENVWRM